MPGRKVPATCGRSVGRTTPTGDIRSVEGTDESAPVTIPESTTLNHGISAGRGSPTYCLVTTDSGRHRDTLGHLLVAVTTGPSR